MAQNTSSAVMAQRHQEDDDLDYFPTPGWGTRALCEHVLDLRGARIAEPACGRGHMARVLAEYAASVVSSDIQPFGFGDVWDFLAGAEPGVLPFNPPPYRPGQIDWVVTNPPFNNFHRFAQAALNIANRGVALLGRLQMLEGISRYNELYLPYEGHWTVAPFVERLPMEEGCVAPDTKTATAYAWLVIDKVERRPSPLVHIPPCRPQLERADDYDPPEYIEKVRALKKARAEAKKAAALAGGEPNTAAA